MILDEAGALERVGGDRDLLRELIVMFGTEGPKDRKRIEEAIAARNAHGLHLAAHKLKGSVSIFCAQDAYEAAFALELLGKILTPGRGGILGAGLRQEHLELLVKILIPGQEPQTVPDEAAFVLERLDKAATWDGIAATLARLLAALTALQPELDRLAKK